ncbi:MAG: hypothetical protein HWN66_02240 [Candidatus Helarchaeota archaeon]|nr:hypothetical protein [Candidatus Helarchaeota archaeon]
MRAFFKRLERSSSQTDEPQNIWEGNYFRELDEYVEEDNLRLQEIIRNTVRHHARNRNVNLPPMNHLYRDKNLFYSILDEMDLHVSLAMQVIFIHKKYGMFEIDLNDSNVHFVPSHCLACDLNCPNKRRHICIVLHENTCSGWANVGLGPTDFLLLSKAIALENDIIPVHVKNQINRSIYCRPPVSTSPEIIQQLKDHMFQELERLQAANINDNNSILNNINSTFVPNPSVMFYNPSPQTPPLNMTNRAAIMWELRNLFRRGRNRRA